MKVSFRDRTEVVPNTGIWEYTFDTERALDFVPGQYLDLTLLGVTDDPRGGSRTFSITSLPDDTLFSFIVKHFELQSPYKQRLQALQTGDEANIGDAMGDMILPKYQFTPLVFVAGGIGIASYASIFKDLLARREERAIFLFYQLRSQRERLYKGITESYPLMHSSVVVAPHKITAEEIQAVTPPDAYMYLSGSQKFVENLRSDLEARGVPREQIVFDYYDGYAEL